MNVILGMDQRFPGSQRKRVANRRDHWSDIQNGAGVLTASKGSDSFVVNRTRSHIFATEDADTNTQRRTTKSRT